MTSWSELSKLLVKIHGVGLKHLEFQTSKECDHFPIRHLPAAVAPVPVATTGAVPASAPKDIAVPSAPLPPVPHVPSAPLPPVPHVAPATTVSRSPVVVAERAKIPVASKHSIDPIVLGLAHIEPLYEGSTYSMRQRMEKEAAIALESQLDTLYKTNSGRSRGWTKSGIESMMKPRCASGGDLKELDRAKKPFLWALVCSDKGVSAFLDFICCARRIHCAVLDAEKRTAYLYPAADCIDLDDKRSEYPLYVVDNTGHSIVNMHTTREFLAFIDKNGWQLMPPHSVLHSLSGLKLDELESVGKKLGMAAVVGNKSERVDAIAEFKTRARLVAH